MNPLYRPIHTFIIFCSVSLISVGTNVQAGEPLMLVNFGAGGGWYDPATNGQGFSFDIIPESNQIVAYWFTYPELGGAREWYVAQGDINGNAVEMVIYQTSNGLFGQSSDVDLSAVGSAVLDFDSCHEATWNYVFDATGLNGEILLARLGPTRFCEQFLLTASTDLVSHTNAWIDVRGEWLFEGCVNLENSDSHGNEVFIFDDSTITLQIERYSQPDCQGTATQQIMTLTGQRVDKTQVLLEEDPVIANRFILTDSSSGQEIRQVFYVDDRGPQQVLTHGILGAATDSEGFPSAIPPLFFARQN